MYQFMEILIFVIVKMDRSSSEDNVSFDTECRLVAANDAVLLLKKVPILAVIMSSIAVQTNNRA